MAEKEEKKTTHSDNSFGVAGVIFGILSILSLSVGGIAIGIIGLIFSLRQKKIMKNQWSKSGIVLNIIGIIIGIAVVIFLVKYASDYLAQITQAGQLQGLPGGFPGA